MATGMTLSDLTVSFEHVDPLELLSNWVWLIGCSKLPILVSAAGDAFVEDVDSGVVYFLNVVEGTISAVAANCDEFKSLLLDREFVASHFAVEMVGDLRQRGLVLLLGEVYSFRKPPILGGELTFENVERADVAVHFSLMGQLHEHVAKLPPGTPISEMKLR